MHKLCEYIDDELMELERKVEKNGKLSNAEMEYGKELAKFKTALLTNEAMEEYEDDYSNDYMGGNSYERGDNRGGNRSNRGNSYARGRGRNARRDCMGRYSRDGYSRDEAKDEMIDEIKDLMHDAPDERTKQEFRRFIDKLENM